MKRLEQFYSELEKKGNPKKTFLIEAFAFYLIHVENKPFFDVNDIKLCFSQLRVKEYSNIPQYLREKSYGKTPTFLKCESGYCLTRQADNVLCTVLNISALKANLEIKEIVEASNSYFSSTLLKETRGYLEKTGDQIRICYDVGAYDGALVLLRKLLETLIIELFESKKIQNKIKGPDGYYLYLSELIPILLDEKSFTLGRNTIKSLPKIKQYGDLSAHNRRFSADKAILDNMRDDVRITIEELIHLIDFKSLKS